MGQRRVTREIRRYFVFSNYENTTNQNLCKEVQTVPGEKFTKF